MDKDIAKVELKEMMMNFLENNSSDRDFYIGDNCASLMADAALNALLAIEDAYRYMDKEGIL